MSNGTISQSGPDLIKVSSVFGQSFTDPFFTANGLKAGATLPITQNYRDITIVVVARRWRKTSAVTCQLRFETLIAESERIVVYA